MSAESIDYTDLVHTCNLPKKKKKASHIRNLSIALSFWAQLHVPIHCLELQRRRVEGALALCVLLLNPIKYDVICWASVVLRLAQRCRTNDALNFEHIVQFACRLDVQAWEHGPIMCTYVRMQDKRATKHSLQQGRSSCIELKVCKITTALTSQSFFSDLT